MEIIIVDIYPSVATNKTSSLFICSNLNALSAYLNKISDLVSVTRKNVLLKNKGKIYASCIIFQAL